MKNLDKNLLCFNINSYFYNLSRGDSSNKYNIEITYPLEEDKDNIVIGNIELRYFPNLYDVNDQLDEHSSTELFINLFENNNGDLKSNISKKLGSVFDKCLIVLEKIEIKDEFKGNKLMNYILYIIINYLNLNNLEIALVLKVFPLQYEAKNENFNLKKYTKDHTKLSKYYKSIGFKKLDDENSIYGINSNWF